METKCSGDTDMTWDEKSQWAEEDDDEPTTAPITPIETPIECI